MFTGKFTEHPRSGTFDVRASGAIHIDENNKLWSFDHSKGPRHLGIREISELTREKYNYGGLTDMYLATLIGATDSDLWGKLFSLLLSKPKTKSFFLTRSIIFLKKSSKKSLKKHQFLKTQVVKECTRSMQ